MAISSTTNRVTYTGNGVTTTFSFPYQFHRQADIVVVETVIATGVQTVKTLTTDYTISGTPDASGIYQNGADIVAVSAPANTKKWTIYRDPALTQTQTIVDNDPLPAAAINNPLDLLTIIAQRLSDRLDRAVHLSDGFTVTFDPTLPTVLTAGATLVINAAGNGFDLGAASAPLLPGTLTALDYVRVNAGGTAYELRTPAQVLSDIGGIANSDLTAYAQPLDADLTAIAALSTTSVGRSLLEIANAAAGRTILSAIAADSTDVLTNKTYDTAGTGNVLKINGTAVSDKTGTGKVVLDTSPTLVTPVLGAASATSITLGSTAWSKYERGSWTPTIAGGGTPGTPTYSTQTGRYVWNGDAMLVWGRLAFSAISGSPTGSATIGGVPAAVGNVTGLNMPGSMYASNVTYDAGNTHITPQAIPNTSTLTIAESGSANLPAALPVGNLMAGGSSTDMRFSCSYYTNT